MHAIVFNRVALFWLAKVPGSGKETFGQCETALTRENTQSVAPVRYIIIICRHLWTCYSLASAQFRNSMERFWYYEPFRDSIRKMRTCLMTGEVRFTSVDLLINNILNIRFKPILWSARKKLLDDAPCCLCHMVRCDIAIFLLFWERK